MILSKSTVGLLKNTNQGKDLCFLNSSEYFEIFSLLIFNGFDPPAAAALSRKVYALSVASIFPMILKTVSNTNVFQDIPVLRTPGRTQENVQGT